jgi:hypothetical protein
VAAVSLIDIGALDLAAGEPLSGFEAQSFRTFTKRLIRSLASSDSDAMGAWALTLPPGAPVAAPAQTGSGGQFWIVLEGALRWPRRVPLACWSCLYLGANDPSPAAVTAGDAGLVLLVMRLPARAMPGACTTAAIGAPACRRRRVDGRRNVYQHHPVGREFNGYRGTGSDVTEEWVLPSYSVCRTPACRRPRRTRGRRH